MANDKFYSEGQLSKEDFLRVAEEQGVQPGFARKTSEYPTALVKVASERTEITTKNTKDGSIQAQSVAEAGDAIATRIDRNGDIELGPSGEPDRWVVPKDKAEKLYAEIPADDPHHRLFMDKDYKPKHDAAEYGNPVMSQNYGHFIELPNGGDVEPPWGGRQQTSDGVLFYSEVTGEVYLNEADGFKTFSVEKEPSPLGPKPGQSNGDFNREMEELREAERLRIKESLTAQKSPTGEKSRGDDLTPER